MRIPVEEIVAVPSSQKKVAAGRRQMKVNLGPELARSEKLTWQRA
jgi:hypothetical protein